MIRALLPRRIPLFVEKPLVSDAAQLPLLRGEAERLFVMDKWRYHSGVRELARLVRAGELGRLESVHCTRWGWGSKPRDTDVLWYLAPHDLAIVQELLGAIPTPVAARFQRSPDGTAVGCVALLGQSPWVGLTMSEVHPSHIREIRVCGSEGMALLPDSYSPCIVRYRWSGGSGRSAPPAERIPIAQDLPLRQELAHSWATSRAAAPRRARSPKRRRPSPRSWTSRGWRMHLADEDFDDLRLGVEISCYWMPSSRIGMSPAQTTAEEEIPSG